MEMPEHEGHELGVAWLGPEDMSGRPVAAPLLDLEDAHPEGILEKNGETRSHDIPLRARLGPQGMDIGRWPEGY